LKISLRVNGKNYELEGIHPLESLADVLRERLGLTGTKRGCDTGGCGMCTVVADGKPVYSCIMPAWQAQETNILTVEGLSGEKGLHPLQESFIKNFAFQCGYCTPAFLLVAKSLLDSNPDPTDEEIREAISGVLCRCTAYAGYIKSIKEVAKQRQAKNSGKTDA
jgi:aerobic-type carbon monoxide dehydrogenase small subunit (CoxS/CutS family)